MTMELLTFLDSFNIQQIVTVYYMLDPWSNHWGDKGELDKT